MRVDTGNLQSMVFDATNLRLWIADARDDRTPACNARYARVSLRRYFADATLRSLPA